jgi:hypothetical protein
MAEGKPIPVRPGESTNLIQVGGTNFASMNSVEALNSMEASAPSWHRATMDRLKAAGKVREENIQPEQFEQRQSQVMLRDSIKTFGQGAIVKNAEGKKLTIIKASAGYTKKTRTPVHKVADKAGNVWLEKETNLKLIL